MILLLIMRAYFSLVRTLGYGIGIEGMETDDMKRDAEQIICGTDKVRAFMRSSLIRFDQKGVHSKMMIPVDVLIHEFEMFTYGGKTTGAGRRMELKEFLGVLSSANASKYIKAKKNVDTGPDSVFSTPTYRYIK